MADAAPPQQPPPAGTSPRPHAESDPELLDQSQEDSILSSSSQQQDGEKHPKGKRKRTATKDKMVLEEAYNSNPKPDKQARLEIVQRVSLNEKEVQIWFQNRRQNDRRKSRPLSAEEVASMRYAGANPFSSDPNNASSLSFSQSSVPPPPPPQQPLQQQPVSSDPITADNTFYSSPGHAANNPALAQAPPSNDALPPAATPLQARQSNSQYTSFEAPTPVGYLANRWNLGSTYSTPPSISRSSAAADDSFRRGSFTGSNCSPDTSIHSTQSQSNVRLSLSLEGKAELISGLSPDRIPPIDVLPPRATLQRSQSAITLPPVSTLLRAASSSSAASSRRPSMRGRSRDVAAWVSAAHAETNDELTAQAENETTGSAIAAITLLRSASGSILQNSGSVKRNSSLSRSQQQMEPVKKRRFNRAISSIARLETTPASAEMLSSSNSSAITPLKDVGGSIGRLNVARLLSPTDSDKENLSPDEDGNPRNGSRRSVGHSLGGGKRPNGKALQENGISLLNSKANNLGASARQQRGGKHSDGSIAIFEDDGKVKKHSQQHQQARVGKGKEDEVEKFMRGQVSPSKKPDMDCVAGLLSLSQGAWR